MQSIDNYVVYVRYCAVSVFSCLQGKSTSLSDAEVFEDIPQYFVGLYFSAGDFSEMVEAAAEVLADEVWREAGGESADDAVDVGESRL